MQDWTPVDDIADGPGEEPAPGGAIVSSSHLASGAMPALSEFEFGLILVSHAFHRWMVRCMAAAGVADLSPVDVLILHTVHHREKAKRIADICLVLNIEDTHVVTYSLKKLERLKLVRAGRQGKEKIVSTTPAGARACERYRDLRERMLVRAVQSLGLEEPALSRVAGQMRALSGHYDQAARAAAAV